MKPFSITIINPKVMKKTIFLIAGVLLIFASYATDRELPDKENTLLENPVSLLCSPDMYDLAVQWVGDFCKMHPGVTINIINVNPGEISGMLENGAEMGIISKGNELSLRNNSLWKLVIGRDVIVPVMNAENPFIAQIDQKGMSPEQMASLINNPHQQGWGSYVGGAGNTPVNYYVINDEKIRSGVAEFIQSDQGIVKGHDVDNGKELVQAVQSDRYGLGFCKLADIINPANLDLIDGIRILPIDKNGNGQLDYFEAIYNNLADFSRGVWIGKYPKPLINNIYFVANATPQNETEVAFLSWVITDGQKILESYGFSELVNSEKQSKLDKFIQPGIFSETGSQQYAFIKTALLIFLILIVGGAIVNIIFRIRGRKAKVIHKSPSNHMEMINETSMNLPTGLYYDKTHTWAFMEQDGTVKVGIDDFIQHVTGTYTKVIMKKPGEKINKKEQILSLKQNGKQLEICSPVSGTIKQINTSLLKDPSLINTSPYSEGWLYSIEPSNWMREIQFLRMAHNHREWLRWEFIRLKDFLAAIANGKAYGSLQFAYQEGGELKNHVLQDMGPEIWEDFQKNFIDTSELK